MNRDHIPGFPHKMPQINWIKNLPIFQDEKFDDLLSHLIKFHKHVWRLKVEWHEDCLMKMFMETLEGKVRNWYQWLEPGILFSLKDFHNDFYKRYIGYFPSLSLAENFCDQFEDLIQHLVKIDEDLGNQHPEELLEEIHAFHTQDNYLDSQEQLIEDEIHQKVREDLQDLSEEARTNDNPSALLCKVQEDIQPQDQPPQKK